MTSVQTKLPFVERKKSSTLKFYSHVKNQESELNSPKSVTQNTSRNPVKRSIRVKKIISLDSDEENIDHNVAQIRLKKVTSSNNSARKVVSDSDLKSEEISASNQGCSPPKIRRTRTKAQATLPLSPTSNLLEKLTLNEETDNEQSARTINVKYQNARQALHSTAPINLPGRENELAELESIIKTSIKNETSISLYVSGPPGTGKTACLSKIIQKKQFKDALSIVYVNCTGIKTSKAIYQRVATELGIKLSGCSERESKTSIENYLHEEHNMILLILDEIDQLDSRKQNILYTIFEWPSYANSKLILIGIANALDLTDRILPRLQSKCELKPKLMHFAPYSKRQIVDIFNERLEKSCANEVFSPVAVQLLAGKVASVSGDARRALDIGRRVVELAEQQKHVDSDSKPNNACGAVGLQQVMSVLNNVYSTSHTLDSKDPDDDACSQSELPLQQCILLCSLLLMLKKTSNKDITVGRLHDVYRRVCASQNLMAVDQTEFVSLCSLVDARGIIRISGKKEPRLKKVSLQWDEEEVGSVLQDKQLMATIMEDVSCLTLAR